MSMIGVSWFLLSYVGPRVDSPALFWLGLPVGLVAGGLYLLGAKRVGRLKAPSRYSLDLDTSGLYSWIRHPQALSLSLLVISIGLMTGSVPLLLSVPVWIGCWIAYTYFEEELELVPTFGQQYLAYRERTPRMWPRLQRAREAVNRLVSESTEARDVS
jgi:protein-S-isoprenylcysteine O-methyltransferase Ste14